MKVIAEELTEDEVAKILVKLGVAEDKTGNFDLSTGERDEDWYFWFVNNNTQVVMEKCRGERGNTRSTVYLMDNDEFIKFWNEHTFDDGYIEFVAPGVIKTVPGEVFTFRNEEDKEIEIVSVIAKDEEAARKYFGFSAFGGMSDMKNGEMIETPEEVKNLIKKIEEDEPDFLREIVKEGPYIIARTEMGRYESRFRKL